MRSLFISGAAVAALLPRVVLAQDAAPVPAPAQDAAAATDANTPAPAPSGVGYHSQPGNEIIVTGVLSASQQDVLSGVDVLKGTELTAATRPSIGETLEHAPGVSATSFGPSASRPVLRGLQGERVKLLTDGIGAIDVSNTSVDHAAVVNPLLAERIEVLRGPQALLYGSAAIGGVVNVIDRSIPTQVPDEPAHVEAVATYGSAANERSLAGSLDSPLGGGVVFHVDGTYLKSDDLHIGGYALTPEKRAEALATAAAGGDPGSGIDFAANAAIHGTLPNTANETWNAGTGLAWIGDNASLGLAYSHYDSLYGVPVRYATLAGQGQEAPRLDLLQNRFDARAELDPAGGWLRKIRFRGAYASYRHFELAEDGSINTAFYDHGLEGRLELTQADRGAWTGASGVQYFSRLFNVVGDEAFLPRNLTDQLGVFTVQQLDYGALKLEGGARFEHAVVSAEPRPDQPQFFAGKRSFDAVSGSLGGTYEFTDGWRFGVNVSRTERIPAAEELFANGPHGGTEAYEVGDPSFGLETALSAEAVLHGSGPGYTFEASAYHTWFMDFIYEDQTGAIVDGLPVYQSRQADARYYGFELQGTVTLAHLGGADLVADGLADYTHATIVAVGPAPRIPPLRLLGGIELKGANVDARAELEHVFDQTRISAFETPTDGYTMVNTELTVRPWGMERPLSFVLSANNLFDVDARRHASYLKDFAPLAGRDIRISARLNI